MATVHKERRVDVMSEREHKLLLGFACVCMLLLIIRVCGYVGEPLFGPKESEEPPVTAVVLNNGN